MIRRRTSAGDLRALDDFNRKHPDPKPRLRCRASAPSSHIWSRQCDHPAKTERSFDRGCRNIPKEISA